MHPPARPTRRRHPARERGLSLVELIIAIVILSILASAASRVVLLDVKRQKERDLRRDLWEMRAAIDKYKDVSDQGKISNKVMSEGYPPDLDTLVNGVDIQGKKMRFLRRLPVDPMTGRAEWGVRSMQDAPDADSSSGDNVFDVYTKSTGTALDGTKYSTW